MTRNNTLLTKVYALLSSVNIARGITSTRITVSFLGKGCIRWYRLIVGLIIHDNVIVTRVFVWIEDSATTLYVTCPTLVQCIKLKYYKNDTYIYYVFELFATLPFHVALKKPVLQMHTHT